MVYTLRGQRGCQRCVSLVGGISRAVILPPIPLSPLQVQNTEMAGSRARALFWLRAGGIVTSLHSVMTTGTGVVVPDSSPLDSYHYPGLTLILQVLLEMTSEINPL